MKRERERERERERGRERETQTTLDPGWRHQREPVRYDRLFPARALRTVVAELDLTVTNTWMNADTEQELFTRSSWSNPTDSLTHMDFIMTSRKLEMKTCAGSGLRLVEDGSQSGASCSFDETENEIHEEDWSELAWLGARRLLAQSGCRDADGVGELECDGAFACGDGEDTQENGNQGVVSNRTRKAPKKTQSKHFNWSSIAKQETPKSVLTNFFQDFCSIPGDQEEAPQSERRHEIELWKKLENGLCKRNAGFAKETGKSLEEVEKRERLTRSDHGRCFESTASGMFGETGEIVVDDVLGYDFPGRLAVLYDGAGSESGGCNVLDQVQATRWAVCVATYGLSHSLH